MHCLSPATTWSPLYGEKNLWLVRAIDVWGTDCILVGHKTCSEFMGSEAKGRVKKTWMYGHCKILEIQLHTLPTLLWEYYEPSQQVGNVVSSLCLFGFIVALLLASGEIILTWFVTFLTWSLHWPCDIPFLSTSTDHIPDAIVDETIIPTLDRNNNFLRGEILTFSQCTVTYGPW